MVDELTGKIIGQRYQVVRRIGQGGMGAVYLVNDTNIDRQRALKTLLPRHGPDEGMRERFEIERAALKAVSHESVVEITDLGFDEERQLPFLVMELLEGSDLKQILKRQKRLSPVAALKVLQQVARALDSIHAQGVVHRDLKPSNVFIRRREEAPAQVKVLDFGIAKLLTANADDSTIAGGTPGFAAPEQLEGKGIGPHTDIYAFGKLANALLYGYRSEAVRKPAGFIGWLCVATAHEPARRFTSASLAVRDLARALKLESGSSSRYLEWAELEVSPPEGGEVVAPPEPPEPPESPTDERKTELAATVLLPSTAAEQQRRRRARQGLAVAVACAFLLLAWYTGEGERKDTPAVTVAAVVPTAQATPPAGEPEAPEQVRAVALEEAQEQATTATEETTSEVEAPKPQPKPKTKTKSKPKPKPDPERASGTW